MIRGHQTHTIWIAFLLHRISGVALALLAHMFGGLRLMALEFLPWTSGQKTLAASAVAVSTLLAGLFLLKAI